MTIEQAHINNSLYSCFLAKDTEQEPNREYARGLVVGIVTGLMAAGKSFEQAWRICQEAVQVTKTELKWEHVLACAPESWRNK